MKGWVAAVAALLLAIGVWAPALADDDGRVSVQVRLWQDANSASRVHLSARAEGGSWSTLGTVRLTVDEEGSDESRRRYESVDVVAPLPGGNRGATARVEVRVEQEMESGGFHVGARGEGQFWGEPETEPLALSGSTPRGWFRFGDITFDVAVSTPSQRHLDLKRYMLQLINAERAEAGVGPVVLGENDAAQLHAEASLAGCYSSHWGQDGLKPYMRYSLTGGHNAIAENGLGLDYCVTAADFHAPLAPIRQEVEKAVDAWMGSEGHANNILDPWHRAVNIGLAWDRYNFRAIQKFEGDYLEYTHPPTIEGGWIELAGTVKNGVRFSEPGDLHVRVNYDAPPVALTLGQITRTYCYDSGPAVVGLRRPLPPQRFYLSEEFSRTYRPCPNPYHVPPDAPAPGSPAEANAFWQAARDATEEQAEVNLTVPWITAEEWTARGQAFSLKADISEVVAERGAGVYTVLVWGNIDGEFVLISRYSIFHEAEPPEGYVQHR